MKKIDLSGFEGTAMKIKREDIERGSGCAFGPACRPRAGFAVHGRQSISRTASEARYAQSTVLVPMPVRSITIESQNSAARRGCNDYACGGSGWEQAIAADRIDLRCHQASSAPTC